MPALPPERPGCPKAPGERRPLPDPAAVRLYLVPDSAPPYDDEVPAGTTAMPETATRSPATGRPGTGGPGTGGPGTGRPVAGDGSAPDWQSRFAQALAETLAGSRPARQIQPWTTRQAREHIQRPPGLPKLAGGFTADRSSRTASALTRDPNPTTTAISITSEAGR